MSVNELNRNQLVLLKQSYLIQENERNEEMTYWSDLADADEIVSDELIYDEYAGYDFSEDDFS